MAPLPAHPFRALVLLCVWVPFCVFPGWSFSHLWWFPFQANRGIFSPPDDTGPDKAGESQRRKPVLGQTSLWGGPWGQDPSGQSNGHHHGPCKEHKQRGDVCNKWGGSREQRWGDGGRLLSPVSCLSCRCPLLSSGSLNGVEGSGEPGGRGSCPTLAGRLFPAGLGLGLRDCSRSQVWRVSSYKTHEGLSLAACSFCENSASEICLVLSYLLHLAGQA